MLKNILKIFGLYLAAGLVFAALLCLLLQKLLHRPKVFQYGVLAGYLLFFLLYLQGNWLVGDLPPLDGSEIQWSAYGKLENIIFVLAALLLCAAAGWVVIRTPKGQGAGRAIRAAIYGTLAVLAMLAVSLVSVSVGNVALQDSMNKGQDETFISTDHFHSASRNRNFLIFVVDTIDARAFTNLLRQNPEYETIFENFTFYPDTTSAYPFTRNAIVQILSGEVDLNEEEFGRFSTNALNNSAVLAALDERGYTIDIYESDLIWRGERRYTVRNETVLSRSSTNLYQFAKEEVKYDLFKYLPYFLKRYSSIGTMDFDRMFREGIKFWDRDDYVYQIILQHPNLQTQKENMFQFIHIEGAHEPFNFDKEMNQIEGGTYEQKVEASMTLLQAWLERLKKSGTYDNSVILILADHGRPYPHDDPQDELPILSHFNPLLLVKGVDERHPLAFSELPVSYFDLPDAYLQLLDGAQSGDLFAQAVPGRTRTMLYLHYSEEEHIVEYATEGKAWECSQFYETGNVYDLAG